MMIAKRVEEILTKICVMENATQRPSFRTFEELMEYVEQEAQKRASQVIAELEGQKQEEQHQI